MRDDNREDVLIIGGVLCVMDNPRASALLSHHYLCNFFCRVYKKLRGDHDDSGAELQTIAENVEIRREMTKLTLTCGVAGVTEKQLATGVTFFRNGDALFSISEFNPHLDTPIEILHTLLLDKLKVHLLVHFPMFVDRFGPAIGVDTQKQEEYNGFVCKQIFHTNRQKTSEHVARLFTVQKEFHMGEFASIDGR
ncbi:hypothetical protein HK098_004987 [Nowakowskiella sp. JEL0407]|nr:hypothetical protein HK098_004987 [Nowakowskiella sp. JEL0407]